jgi:myo-inositol 2-dehydrogenase/D-chiro-inositol 1-dehydrogenase
VIAPCSARDPLRIAVIGVGRIGSMHARLVAQEIPGARLASVADVSRATATSVAESLGVPARSVDEAITADDTDAVAICTSTGTHADLIIAAATAGKAIFCEKPISLDLASVDRAIAAADAARVLLMVGFNRRFDPAHRAVRQAVVAGEIGEPHLVRISSRDPAPPPLAYIAVSGGIFLDMTIHDFDMARFVTDSEVVEAYAQGAVRIDPAIGEAGDVDTAVVTLRHANGCLTTIDNSRQAVYGFDQRVEVFGSRGMAASENPPSHTTVVSTATGTRRPKLPHFFLDRYTPSYLHEWAAFVDAVRTGAPSPVTGHDGRAPLAIGLAAWRSVHEHRPVAVAETEAGAAL